MDFLSPRYITVALHRGHGDRPWISICLLEAATAVATPARMDAFVST
jgi:hypothetical protein